MAKVAVLMLTPACNMSCDFCGAEDGFGPIPYGEAASLVDRLAEEGVQSVVLGGGEPFLWKHELLHLARRVRQRGMLVQVGTNATLVPHDDAVLGEFDRWILPVESLEGHVHDAMRPFEGGHLQHVVSLLERLRRAQIEATISTLVTHENFDGVFEIGAFLSWYQRKGGRVHAWHLYRFLSVGRGGSCHAERFTTAPGVFESLGEIVKQRFGTLRIYLRPDMYHSKETSFYWWQNGELKRHASILQETAP
jgi:MoaA/NifB/PqqE/SkfB family radical SAM enzyme